MSNTNMAIVANNIIFYGTRPTLPDKVILDHVNCFTYAVVIENTTEFLQKSREIGDMFALEYIGDLDFYNEVLGLVKYISDEGLSVWNFTCEPMRNLGSRIIDTPFKNFPKNLKSFNMIINTEDMNVYRVVR